LYYSRPDTIRFEMNDLDASHPISFSVTLQGRTDGFHYSWASVKNGSGTLSTIGDSTVNWANKASQTFTKVLPGNALTEGLTNSLRLWGKGSGGSPDPNANYFGNVSLNYFEATYWRGYQALGDYIDANSASSDGETQIAAG